MSVDGGDELVGERYLDLVKRAVSGSIRVRDGVTEVPWSPSRRVTARGWAPIDRWLRRHGLALAATVPVDERALEEGYPLAAAPTRAPDFGDTMIGRRRLDQLHRAVEDVLDRGVPGDLIETGVWRGGACILMRAVLAARGVGDRRVVVADSFVGLPPPDPGVPQDAGSEFHLRDDLRVDADAVRRAFAAYGLLDDQVELVEGWFRDSLPALRDRTWAVVRLDGDLYESTTDGLENLYDGLSQGGYLVVDDYGAVPACRAAVDDFRERRSIRTPLTTIDWTGCYWIKEEAARR